MEDQSELPVMVEAARQRAGEAGFTFSSETEVGTLLGALAQAVPSGGRILELGTGVGYGLAWLVHGLGDRRDVTVVTVESDEARQRRTMAESWPDFVRFELGDGAVVVRTLGTFDLIFADAPGGKTTGLDDTVSALRPGGILVVDDMDLSRHDDPDLRRQLAEVRRRLHADTRLVVAELAYSSGVILAVRAH